VSVIPHVDLSKELIDGPNRFFTEARETSLPGTPFAPPAGRQQSIAVWSPTWTRLVTVPISGFSAAR